MDIIRSLYESGGPITVLIVLAGLVSIYLVVERLFHFQRIRVDVDEFINGLSNNLRHNNIIEAIKICDETPGPVPHLIRMAILRADKPEGELRDAIRDVSLNEIPRLERNISVLAVLAYLTPLLGLLGTVLGMIATFKTLKTGGINVSAADLAGGIEAALYTTAAGLSVAIPAYGFYSMLLKKLEHVVLDMEKACNDIVYFLTNNKIDIASLRVNGNMTLGRSE